MVLGLISGRDSAMGALEGEYVISMQEGVAEGEADRGGGGAATRAPPTSPLHQPLFELLSHFFLWLFSYDTIEIQSSSHELSYN